MGEVEWKMRGTIVRFDPSVCWPSASPKNRVVWAFHLAATTSGGTLLTQRRETPDGISEESLRLTDASVGGLEVFIASLRAHTAETLERIKAAAER